MAASASGCCAAPPSSARGSGVVVCLATRDVTEAAAGLAWRSLEAGQFPARRGFWKSWGWGGARQEENLEGVAFAQTCSLSRLLPLPSSALTLSPHTLLPLTLPLPSHHTCCPSKEPSPPIPSGLLHLPPAGVSHHHPHSESHRSPCREGRQRPGSPPGPSRSPHPPRGGHPPPPPRPVPAAPAPGSVAGSRQGSVPGGAAASPGSRVAEAPGLRMCSRRSP